VVIGTACVTAMVFGMLNLIKILSRINHKRKIMFFTNFFIYPFYVVGFVFLMWHFYPKGFLIENINLFYLYMAWNIDRVFVLKLFPLFFKKIDPQLGGICSKYAIPGDAVLICHFKYNSINEYSYEALWVRIFWCEIL